MPAAKLALRDSVAGVGLSPYALTYVRLGSALDLGFERATCPP